MGQHMSATILHFRARQNIMPLRAKTPDYGLFWTRRNYNGVWCGPCHLRWPGPWLHMRLEDNEHAHMMTCQVCQKWAVGTIGVGRDLDPPEGPYTYAANRWIEVQS